MSSPPTTSKTYQVNYYRILAFHVLSQQLLILMAFAQATINLLKTYEMPPIMNEKNRAQQSALPHSVRIS